MKGFTTAILLAGALTSVTADTTGGGDFFSTHCTNTVDPAATRYATDDAAVL